MRDDRDAMSLRLGFNTYCLRALRWPDAQMLDYAAGQQLDAIFLQDSPDPLTQQPAHWAGVKAQAARLGLELQTGGGGILPKTADGIDASIATLRQNITRAAAMGSPFVRCVQASERAAFPVPAEQAMEWTVRILRAVKPQLKDARVKAIIEVHKDLQAWEMRQVIEAAGPDIVGIYLDTGNPVFVLEDPFQTLETLAPYVQCAHLRDSVVYEHPRGVAVQWVPLGEGNIDFKAFVKRLEELCPKVCVFNKPITGRPPTVIPYLEPGFWKLYPKARSADLARFLDLARHGRPYEGHMVIEDLTGRPIPEQFLAAIQFQQRDHVERGLAYCKQTLNLGVRWRQSAAR